MKNYSVFLSNFPFSFFLLHFSASVAAKCISGIRAVVLALLESSTMAADMAEVLNRLDRMTIDIVNFGMRQNQLEFVHERSFQEIKESIDEGR